MPAAIRILLAVTLAACATGGSASDEPKHDASPGADAPRTDAPTNPPVDAPLSIDAPIPVDAPPGSFFCSDSAMCIEPGECCFTAGQPMGFCAPGDIVFGVCFPN